MVCYTARERTVLRLLSWGYSSIDIAAAVETMSVATVNLHLTHCQVKAGVISRTQLILYLFQNPRVLLRGGRGAHGLHEPSPTCQCRFCRMHRGEIPLAPDGEVAVVRPAA